MNRMFAAVSLGLLSCTAMAAEPVSDPARQELPNEKIGPRVQNVEPAVPPRSGKLLEEQGRWLNEQGIRPHLSFTQMYLRNPSTGLQTGNHESVSIFAIGADFDLQKLAGIDGGAVHFEQLYVPWTSNLTYGGQVGSITVGKPGPYIPQVSHLTLFTYEQKLLDDRLALEVGKSNAGNYFALPLCNLPLGCVNAILQDSAGINPPPYANWSARASYDFSPALRAQLGAWRSDNAYPFTNGWERHGAGTLSTVYLANLAYRTDFSMESYPQSYEVLAFHNNSQQNDPYYANEGGKGVSGFYLGAKKTFWRADDGAPGVRNPTALTAYASFTHTLDSDVTNGLQSQANAGVILAAPFRSRPFDSYSFNVNWARVTDREQGLLKDANLLSGGSGYQPGREEWSVGVDANFVLTDSIILSPFVTRTFGATSWMNPYTSITPRDGYATGVLLHVRFDEMLGLNPRH